MSRAARVALPLAAAIVLAGAVAAGASEAAGEALSLEQILWELGIKVLDVAIIAFFGFKFLSKPIAAAMEGRAAAVRSALDEASAGRRQAEERLREFQEKNARLEAEIEALVKQTGVDIEREQALILAEAQAAAERVREHARETLRQEFAKARAELHREAADLAVRLATESVRAQVGPADQGRLAADYLRELEAAR